MSIGTPVSLGSAHGTGASIVITTGADSPASNEISVGTLFGGSVLSGVPTITGVTDSAGNTYTGATVVSITVSAIGTETQLWSCPNAKHLPSGGTITVALSKGSSPETVIGALSTPGIAAASPIDKQNGVGGTSTAAASGSSGTLSQAAELAIYLVGVGSGHADTYTRPSGFSTGIDVAGATNALHIAYEIVSATTALSPSATLGTSRTWVANIVTFKASTATTITADCRAPAEWGAGARGDAAVRLESTAALAADAHAPAEWFARLIADTRARLESLGALRGDGPAVLETLTGLNADTAAAVEWSGALHIVADGVGRIEWTAGVAGAAAVPAEMLAGLARDAAAPVQSLAAARAALGVPLETLAAVAADSPAAAEWLHGLAASQAAPIEILAAVQADAAAPIELLARVFTDTAAAVQWIAALPRRRVIVFMRGRG